MSTLASMSGLNALRTLQDQATDQDLAGNISTLPGVPVNPLMASMLAGVAPPGQSPGPGASGGGVPAQPQPAAPVNPAVQRQHALWLAIQQQQQAANQGQTPESLGSPGPFPASVPSPPGPNSGINTPAPAQPPAAPPSSVDPVVAKLMALGSPNSPQNQAIIQKYKQDQALADTAADLKQSSLGASPIDGQLTIGDQYDPTRSGPYGFNPSVMAGAIPQGSVNVPALVQKDKLDEWNALHPDFRASRFSGGGDVVDDRGPLLKSIVDGSNVALPAYRVKRAGQEEPKAIAKLPPQIQRAVIARDKDIARDKELNRIAEDSGKHWHGDVSMTDEDWNAARGRQRTTDNEKATKRNLAKMERRDRESKLAPLMSSMTEGVSNIPPGLELESPAVKEAWMHAQAVAHEGALDRQNRVKVAEIQAGHNDPKMQAQISLAKDKEAIGIIDAELADPKTTAARKQQLIDKRFAIIKKTTDYDLSPPAAEPEQPSSGIIPSIYRGINGIPNPFSSTGKWPSWF